MNGHGLDRGGKRGRQVARIEESVQEDDDDGGDHPNDRAMSPAATQGRYSPRGIMALSTMYPLACAPGTAHTDAEKARVLKVAAGRDKGRSSALAWLQLGRLYREGVGLKVDLRQALHCFQESALRNEPFGALEAGKMLVEGGPGFKQDLPKAKQFYELAANSGKVPEADRRLGEWFVVGPPEGYPQALHYFLEAFELDPIINASAGLSAARMLSHGLGCPGGAPDHPQALRLLQKSAASGKFGPARVRLAVMYDLGVGGVKMDPLKSRTYWKDATLSDMPEAHYRCGVLALHGAGFVKSERSAVNGFRRATRLGFPLAAQRLGALRGERAVGAVEARRAPQKDFLDEKYAVSALYPWPFYDDEVTLHEQEESEREEKEAAAREEKKKAKIQAMLTGAKIKVKPVDPYEFTRPPPWQLPPPLRAVMDAERAELLRCIDTFETHMPTRYEPPPPPKPDRVRTFFKAAGLSGLKLATVPIFDAVVALNGEGQEGGAFEGSIEGYRNAVFDQQGLDRRIGRTRKSAKPMTVAPSSLGHANLEGFTETHMYSRSQRGDNRFLSAASAEGNLMAAAKAKAAAKVAKLATDKFAVATLAKGLDLPLNHGRVDRNALLMASATGHSGTEAEADRRRRAAAAAGGVWLGGGGGGDDDDASSEPGSSQAGGGGFGALTGRSGSVRGSQTGGAMGQYPSGSVSNPAYTARSLAGGGGATGRGGAGSAAARAVTAAQAKSSLAAGVLGARDMPPSWMYDKVWMERPVEGNSALSRAVELRRNYGTAPRLGRSPS